MLIGAVYSKHRQKPGRARLREHRPRLRHPHHPEQPIRVCPDTYNSIAYRHGLGSEICGHVHPHAYQKICMYTVPVCTGTVMTSDDKCKDFIRDYVCT